MLLGSVCRTRPAVRDVVLGESHQRIDPPLQIGLAKAPAPQDLDCGHTVANGHVLESFGVKSEKRGRLPQG